MIEELKALAEKATPGPWETDTLKSEGEYGSGPDTVAGFEVTAIYNAKGEVLFDALNSDAIVVHEDYGDEDGYVLAWDQISAANAALIVTLVNNLPAILSALEAVPVMKEALEPFVSGYLHTSVFLSSRERMHPAGQELYAEDVERARQALAALEGK
jgi:hypothetical protein